MSKVDDLYNELKGQLINEKPAEIRQGDPSARVNSALENGAQLAAIRVFTSHGNKYQPGQLFLHEGINRGRVLKLAELGYILPMDEVRGMYSYNQARKHLEQVIQPQYQRVFQARTEIQRRKQAEEEAKIAYEAAKIARQNKESELKKLERELEKLFTGPDLAEIA